MPDLEETGPTKNTDHPLPADRCGFYKVEKWSREGCRTIGWMINVKPPLPSHCGHGRFISRSWVKGNFRRKLVGSDHA